MAVKYNPYGGSNRSGKSGGYSPYPSGYGSAPSGSSGLTAQQLLALLNAQKQQHSESFVDRIKHAGSSGLHAVSWTFDKLLRPEYAIATAIDQGVGKHGSLSGALHGAVKGFEGKGDHGFGEVLAHHGVLSGHARLRGLAGFALDVAADPLTYVSGGAGGFLAKSAEHEALIKAGRVALSSGKISHDAREGMALAADQLAHGGEKYAYRHALAKEQANYMAKILGNRKVTDLEKGRLATLREAAHAEERSVEQRLPAYSIGGAGKRVQITPTHIAGQRIVPALPKLQNVIDRGGIGSGLAKSFSAKFIRSPHETAATHALGITGRHLAEEYNNTMLQMATEHFKGIHLSEAQMLDALHHMEAADKAVIKTKNGAYHLNINHIQKLRREGKLSADQEKFVRAWHKVTQELYKRDKSFNIHYQHLGERGQLYVPHRLVDKMGHPLADVQINKLTKAGFQHARATAKFSVKQLKEMADAGNLGREVETNPYNLLVHTIRSRAQKQSDMTLLHSVAGSMGTKTRLVDEAKLAKNLRGQATLTKKIASSQAQHAEALSAAHTKEQLFLAEHELNHANKMEKLIASFDKARRGKGVPLTFHHIDKGDMGHVIGTTAEGKQAHLTYYKNAEGLHTVQQVRVPEELRRQGVARQLFYEAQRQLGGTLRHETNPDLLSPEGKAFAEATPIAEKLNPNAKRALTRIVKAQEAHAAETQKIAAGQHEVLNELTKVNVSNAEKHAADIANMQKELKRLGQVEQRIRVGKGNRSAKLAQLKTVAGAVDEHGHPLAFDPTTAHAIENYQKIVSGDDKAIQDFSKGWAKWVANWKLLVTSVNPGYRIRNTMSDVWAMYISGMPMSQVAHYGVVAKKLMMDAKKGDPSAIETMREAYHHGILSGLFQGDVQRVGKMIAREGRNKTGLLKEGHAIQAGTKLAQEFNAHVENLGRMTHYLWLRESKGMSAADAAFRVKRAHFDYEDLTPFEQRVMKQVAPFYTWTRKNIPFQIKALAERPGRVLAFPKAAIESEQASGGDKGNILPGFVTDNFGFQVPFGKHNYYLPQIGIADLQALDSKSGLESRTMGLLNPAIKTPLELMLNKSAFTGQPIAGDHPRNPVTPLGAALLSLIPGSNVGETGRMGANGQEVHGPGANPYYAYLLNQVPALNALLVKGGGIKGKNGGLTSTLASELGGQSIQHVDPKLQQVIASIAAQDAVKKQVKGLRDSGVIPPAKTKKSKKQKRVDSMLYNNLGRR